MKVINDYPKKEERENAHFKSFVSLFKGFRIDNWKKKEPPYPDFLVFHESSIIGVEHTSLIDNSMMKVRVAQKQCFIQAMEMAQSNCITPLVVKAKFVNNSRIINIQQAAKELYKNVLISLPYIPINDYFEIKSKHLKCFDWIRIRHSESHDWHEIKLVHFRINPVDEITKAIQKKHEHLKKYIEFCNSCWLLIGIDEFHTPEAFKISNEFNVKFHSEFDRVFILQHYTDKLVELKLKCP